jgi:hypothetical protein
MVSDDGIKHSELLGFWALYIVRYFNEHKISEPGFVFRSQAREWDTPNPVGSIIVILNIIHRAGFI